jgi:hypothetical protein
MFPAAIDRYRVFEKVLRMERRHRRRLGQAALAQRAEVSQATISNLETLATAHQDAHRGVRRDILLRVLTRELLLEQERIDTLLWLDGGTPLTADELRRYVHDYLLQAQPRHYTSAELRQQGLARLRETLSHAMPPAMPHRATVDIIFVGRDDEQSRIHALETVLQMESLPGQRLMVTKHPSYLAHPPEAYQREEFIPPVIASATGRQAIHALNAQRRVVFLRHLELYGERSIHPRTSLERYVRQDGSHYLPLEQRRQHVRH